MESRADNIQRFRTYNLPLDSATPEALAWMKTMWEAENLKKFAEDCFKQSEDAATDIPKYENLFKDNPEIKFGRVKGDWKFEG